MSNIVLFVGAHADDVELGAGGTAAHLGALGFDVHILVMSDEASLTVAAQRRREAVAAGTELGLSAKQIHFLGLVDGAVTCNRQTVGALRHFASTLGDNPIAVFTHAEADSHQDHIATTRIVKAAFRKTSLFKYQVRNSVITSGFAPVLYCAVDRTYDAKLRALKQHESQVIAGRIPFDDVVSFDERWGMASGGRFGEAFELDLQEGASGHTELINLLDSQPFRQLWSPVIATGGLTVLAASQRRAGTSAASDLVLVTRLQERLIRSRSTGVGTHQRFRFDVALSDGATDAARVADGNVLILGGPDVNPAAAALQRWLGIPMQPTSDVRGLLTIARNPLVSGRDASALIFCASGRDDMAVAAAAEFLLDDGRIKSILDRARSVYSGQTASVQIPVNALDPQGRRTTACTLPWSRRRAHVEQEHPWDQRIRA